MQIFGEIALLKEKTANAQILRWKYAWHSPGIVRRSVQRREKEEEC